MKPSKVADFFAGMLGIYLVEALIAALMSAAGLPVAIVPVSIVAVVGLCIFAVARERPFIVLGIAMAFVIPALAFGACMLIFSGVR